jgi:GNAT superfamily N-acetyltransferase
MVVRLTAERAPEIIDVFCDAFRAYPVMTHVAGPFDGAGDARLRALIALFVMTRVHRDEPLLGVAGDDGLLIAAATMTLPGEREMPEAVQAHRARTWAALGDAAHEKHAAYANAAGGLAVTAPHHHLNMIGVRHEFMGRGCARALLDAVHALAAADPRSAGVSLSTELPKNVALYQHFGYGVVGHAQVTPELETWSLFRPTAINA